MEHDDAIYIPPVVDDSGGETPNSIVALAVVAVGFYAVLATVAGGVVVLEGAIGAHLTVGAVKYVSASS